jgi:CRP-like cAMP-binding protein
MQLESLARSLGVQPFVSGMAPADIQLLAGCAKNVRAAPGEFLFREGDPARFIYLIRSGRVALQSDAAGRGGLMLETLGAGEVLGWRALFEARPWHLDGWVVEPTLAFAFDGTCLRGKIAREPAFGLAVTQRLLQAVHERLERARLQQLDVLRGRS